MTTTPIFQYPHAKSLTTTSGARRRMLKLLFKVLFQGGYDEVGVPSQRWASARVLWPAGMYRHSGEDGACGNTRFSPHLMFTLDPSFCPTGSHGMARQPSGQRTRYYLCYDLTIL